MVIGGLAKLTLLDYPSHVAATVFLKGCNFRCPFCYNSSLINRSFENSYISEEEFFKFLNSRIGILDGVAITGGEPTLSEELVDFIRKIKSLGFKVKLDTNGSNPDMLKNLIDNKLIDYVAMDIKGSLEKYPLIAGCKVNLDLIVKSIDIIINSQNDHEFRTTVVDNFHEVADFDKIGSLIKGAKRYYLQCFKYEDSVIDKTLKAPSVEKLESIKKVASKYVTCEIRGVE